MATDSTRGILQEYKDTKAARLDSPFCSRLLPDNYWEDLFARLHISLKRTGPIRYKVVRIKIKDGKPERKFA